MKNIILIILLILFSINCNCQTSIFYKGRIEYSYNMLSNGIMKEVQVYDMYFNDSVIMYNAKTPGTSNSVVNEESLNKLLKNSGLELDSFELIRQKQKIIKELEKNRISNYFFYNLKKGGYNKFYNGKKFLILDTITNAEIILTNDTATIAGFKCQKIMQITPKGSKFYYWVTTTIPYSVNPFGVYNLPGLTVKVENENKDKVMELKTLEYPLKKTLIEEFNFKNILTRA